MILLDSLSSVLVKEISHAITRLFRSSKTSTLAWPSKIDSSILLMKPSFCASALMCFCNALCSSPPLPWLCSRGGSWISTTGAGAALRISEKGGGISTCGACTIAGGGLAITGAGVGAAGGLGSTGLLRGEVGGGSLLVGVARDFASIASTSARGVPYFSLETVVTSCRRAAAALLSCPAGNGTLKLKS